MTTDQAEQMVVSRTIAASPDEVFAVLSDPNEHQNTEPTDWVRDAIDPQPITDTGQVFGMHMFIEAAGGHYDMHNKVIDFEKDRVIAWEPGQLNKDGQLETGGWTWRYDLAPVDGGTEVTLTYDWSRTPEPVRKEIGGMPPFGPDFLDASLATLDRRLSSGA